MKSQEADFSIILRHYLKANPLPISCPIECKDTRGKDSLSFSEVKEEQCNNGMASKSDKGNLIRVSVGTVGAPDYCWYINGPSYLAIKYPLGFVLIDIETFVLERDKNTKKSLSWDRAKEISIRTIII